MKPSEQIALRWTDVDFGQRTVRVQRAVVRGQAKWLDGADKSRERDKLNLGFGHDLAPELIAEANKFAQSNTYLAETQGFEPWIQVLARMLP